jgi:hypothetical protein
MIADLDLGNVPVLLDQVRDAIRIKFDIVPSEVRRLDHE